MTAMSSLVSRGAGLMVMVWAMSCGGASNSEKPGGSGGAGGIGAGGTGTGGSNSGGIGGSSGSGAAGAGGTAVGGAGGAAGRGGSGGAGGTAGAGGTGGMAGTAGTAGRDGGTTADAGPGACQPQPNLTLAVHIVMKATWPGSLSTNGGTGDIHLWNLSKLKVNGNVLSGDQTRSCGTILPEFSLTAIGERVAGGQKVHVEIPHSVWDAPTIPRFMSNGSIAGWNPGDQVTIDGTVALVGLTMPDPMAAWPGSYRMITAVDADGDGSAGFTAVPKNGGGYVPPPVRLQLFGMMKDSADKLYLASRTVVGLKGTLSSCDDLAGTADVKFFDSHVVGCHVRGGADCNATETDFVDQNRTNYRVTSATFTAKRINDDASCADVRAALP